MSNVVSGVKGARREKGGYWDILGEEEASGEAAGE